MSSPAQYIKQLRESNQALTEGMVKYAETIVALRRELAQARGANTLDIMDRAYFAGKDAGIAEAEAVAAARSEQEPFQPDWVSYRQGVADGAAQPEQEPLGYLCENAAGFKYFRHKKPDKVYKPIALYAAAPRKVLANYEIDENAVKIYVDVKPEGTTVVAEYCAPGHPVYQMVYAQFHPLIKPKITIIDESKPEPEPNAGALHPKYHYHPTWAIYDAIREGSMSAEQFRHWCNWTAEETIAMVRGREIKTE